MRISTDYDELAIAYKCGATTKHTIGVFWCDMPLVYIAPGVMRTEYMFAGQPGVGTGPFSPFSCPGDSGSVVFDQEGGVLGLVFGNFLCHQSETILSMVTPIEEIYEDIEVIVNSYYHYQREPGSNLPPFGRLLDIRVL